MELISAGRYRSWLSRAYPASSLPPDYPRLGGLHRSAGPRPGVYRSSWRAAESGRPTIGRAGGPYPMRVALITEHASPLAAPGDAYPAGPGAGLGALATALAGLGVQVTMYAGVPAPAGRSAAARPRRSTLCPGAVLEPLSIQAAEPASSGTGDRDLTALRIRELAGQLASRWQDSPPDLVHAHSWAAGLAAQAGGRELNLPQVQTFYSLAVQDGPRAGARRARLELALARSARAVLVGASADGAALARLGVPQAAIRVVPPGVDTGLFQPDGPVESHGDRPRLLM